MKKIPTPILALMAGIVLELLLLVIGGFDLGVGGDGPASTLLFITHLPARFLCSGLPASWPIDFVIATVNAILLSGIALIIIATKRWDA